MTELVREFHAKYGQPHPATPVLQPAPDLVRFRARLIREEYEEVIAELAKLAQAKDPQRCLEIMRALMGELADLRYVLEGCAVTLGLPLDEAYAEIHRANMTKDANPEPGGKAVKGECFTPPDLLPLMPDFIDIPEEDITHE